MCITMSVNLSSSLENGLRVKEVTAMMSWINTLINTPAQLWTRPSSCYRVLSMLWNFSFLLLHFFSLTYFKKDEIFLFPVWFECETSPTGSCVWTLDPRLMALFRKFSRIVSPWRTCITEPWTWPLVHSPLPIPRCAYSCHHGSTCCHGLPSMVDCLPLNCEPR